MPRIARILTLSLILLASALAPVLAAPATIDVFASKLGLNETRWRAGNIDTTTDAEYIAYDRVFTRDAGLMKFSIPAADPPTRYRYCGAGPFPVAGGYRYALSFRATKKLDSKFMVLFGATFFRGARPLGYETLFTYREAQPGMPLVEQDFMVPPGADRMIVWIGVSNSPDPLPPGPQVVFQSLRLIPRGPLNGTPATRALIGRNLLPLDNFRTAPLGPYAPGPKVFGVGDLKPEIVEQDGRRYLHLVRPGAGYVFPYFNSRPVNLDNCLTEFSFRVKGTGKLQPMIWWWLRDNNWSYYGGKGIELTGEWQTLSVIRGCLNPDMEYAGCSFAIQSDQADFLVDDMKLTVIPYR
ncbi:MAG TPA: hypothetical protein VGM19_02830 [Armatimonadota bacterium]|jgi:hypothetical protein